MKIVNTHKKVLEKYKTVLKYSGGWGFLEIVHKLVY